MGKESHTLDSISKHTLCSGTRCAGGTGEEPGHGERGRCAGGSQGGGCCKSRESSDVDPEAGGCVGGDAEDTWLTGGSSDIDEETMIFLLRAASDAVITVARAPAAAATLRRSEVLLPAASGEQESVAPADADPQQDGGDVEE